MNNQALQATYLRNSIDTASSHQLLIMLYDGAIRFTKRAIDEVAKDNVQEAHNAIVRVQDIVSELMITLNFDYDISKKLYSLYEYFLHLLTEANTTKETQPLEEVLGYLIDLKATWIEASKKAKNHV